MPLHVIPSNTADLGVLGDHVKILLSGKETNAQLSLVQATNKVGGGVPPHTHENEDETFYIIKGMVEFTLGETTVIAREGDTVFGPRNVAHSFRAIGTEPSVMNITMTPAGMEEMFVQVSELPAPHEFPKVAEICARFGIQFLPQPQC